MVSMRISDFQAASSAQLTVDAAGTVRHLDHGWSAMAGIHGAARPGRPIDDFLCPEGSRLTRHYLGSPAQPYGAVFEAAYRCADGTLRDANVTIRPAPAPSPAFLITIEDVRLAAQNRHRSLLTQYTVGRITDMIIWLDEDARYVFTNPAATRLLGYTSEELSRMRVWDIDPLFDPQRWRDHWREIEEKGSFKIETVNRAKNGRDVPIEVTVNFVEYEGVRYNCSIVRDITARKAAEAELRSLNERILRLSNTDGLTGLANRRRFDTVLASEVARHAASGQPLSLILLDLDSFKAFNDLYGHPAGDECLRRVASVLAAAMPEPALAARYGGEEFACILPETAERTALARAEEVRRAIEGLDIVHQASRASCRVTASFGVLTAIGVGEHDSPTLLNLADAALYRAKRAGANRVENGTSAAARPPLAG